MFCEKNLLTSQDWPGREDISSNLVIEDFYITADDKKNALNLIYKS